MVRRQQPAHNATVLAMLFGVALGLAAMPGPASAQTIGPLVSSMTWGWSAVVLVLAACAWAAVMTLRARRLGAELAALRARADAFETANSQFLTMLSHDLRTPLNGVMGLIALARQSGLSPRQSRLLAEAERTGNGLVNLLRDAIDFREMQGAEAEFQHAPLAVSDLVTSLRQCLSDRARRYRLVYSVDADVDLPELINGDLARMRQALSYLCVYLVETVKAPTIEIGLKHDGRNLICIMDVSIGAAAQGSWHPQHVFGRGVDHERPFATDSLAPMIARGLTTRMGGEVRADAPADGRARLTVTLPAPPAERARRMLRVEVRADATALLVQSILDERSWAQWTPQDDPDAVAAILLEGSAPDLAATIARLRGQHRSARIISLGPPLGTGQVDAICPMPPGAGSLAAALTPRPDFDRAVG